MNISVWPQNRVIIVSSPTVRHGNIYKCLLVFREKSNYVQDRVEWKLFHVESLYHCENVGSFWNGMNLHWNPVPPELFWESLNFF